MKPGNYRTRPMRAHMTTTIRVADKEWLAQHPEIEVSKLLDGAFDRIRGDMGQAGEAEPRWKVEVRRTLAERAGAHLTTDPETLERIKASAKERFPENPGPPAGAT